MSNLPISSNCGYTASNQSNMDNARTTFEAGAFVERKKPKMVPCGVCGRKFRGQANVERHCKSVHSAERPWKCIGCSQGFALNEYLRRHFMGQHCKTSSNKCILCGTEFVSLAVLKFHVYTLHCSMTSLRRYQSALGESKPSTTLHSSTTSLPIHQSAVGESKPSTTLHSSTTSLPIHQSAVGESKPSTTLHSSTMSLSSHQSAIGESKPSTSNVKMFTVKLPRMTEQQLKIHIPTKSNQSGPVHPKIHVPMKRDQIGPVEPHISIGSDQIESTPELICPTCYMFYRSNEKKDWYRDDMQSDGTISTIFTESRCPHCSNIVPGKQPRDDNFQPKHVVLSFEQY